MSRLIENGAAEPGDGPAAKEDPLSRNRFRRAVDLARVGVWEWQPATNQVFWSEEVERLWGFAPGTFPGTLSAVISRIHPDDRQAWRENLRACLDEGAEHRLRFRIVLPDGEVRWVQAHGDAERDAGGRVERLLGVSQDVTAQHRAEEELRASEQRLKAAERVAGVGSWELDLASGRLTWSDEVFRLFELDPARFCPSYEGFLEAVHPEDRATVKAAYEQSLRAHCAYSIEHRLRMPDGRIKWVHERGETSFDTAGRALRSIGTVQDVTGRKLADRERQRIQRLYRTLSETNQAVVRTEDRQALLSRVAEIAVRFGGLAVAWIGRWTEQGPLTLQAISGDAGYVDALRLHGVGGDPECALLECREGEARVLNDFRALATGSPDWQRALRSGLRSAAAFPLRCGGIVQAVLCVYSAEPGYFQQEEIRLLYEMAQDLSFALDHLARGEALRDSELRYRELVDNLSDAVALYAPVDDGRDFVIRELNRTALRLARDPPLESLLGRPVREVFPGLVEIGLFDAFGRVWQTGRAERIPLTRYRDARLDLWIETYVYRIPSAYLVVIYKDATEQQRAQQALQLAAAAFEAQEGILITDADARIQRVNRAFSRITGYAQGDVLGTNPRMLGSGRHEPAFFAAMWQRIVAKGYWEGEIWNRRKNGEAYPQWLTISAVKDEQDRITHYVGNFTDITERKAAETRIHELAFFDSLTGLANRRLLRERLDHAMRIAARHDEAGAVLMLDLDHFKTLNDTRGHDAGDALLVEVGKRLRLTVRESDTVARIGGDEFVVLLESLGHGLARATHEAGLVAEKIQSIFATTYDLEAVKGFRVTCSIGVTLYEGLQHSVEDVLKQADVALYEVKRSGRNAVRFFNAEMQRAVEVHAEMEAALHRALEQGELRLFYQPQVYRDGAVIGVEALLRWLPARGAPVSPAEFIPLAEETGLIIDIGRWVLHAACVQLTAWQQRPETRALSVSVNVSAKQFLQPRFVTDVMDILERTGAQPAGLRLELTESVVLEDLDAVIARMGALKQRGIRFSLDDFGTGYSSLSYLKRLPLDEMKIDTSFVQDIARDPNDAAIVRTILAMGRSLQIAVVAEGVETDAQRAFLEQNGCDAFQGYLFGRPMSVVDLERWFEQR